MAETRFLSSIPTHCAASVGTAGPRRRNSMIRNLAALAVLPAVLVALACSPSPTETGAGPGAADAPAVELPPGAQKVEGIERGVKGGRLVMGMADEPKTFNPPLTSDVLSSAVADLLFDRLFDYDRYTQEVVAELAESWKYEADRQRWVFYLRENILWSDGTPITADDFLFGAEAIFHPDVPSQFRELLMVEGKPFSFEAPNPREFIVNIPAVDSTAFIQILNVPALPRHKYGATLRNGTFSEILNTDTPPAEVVSSGPWMLKEFVSGDRLAFVPNPNYYRYDAWGTRLPYLDELVMLSVPDFEAMALRFQAGDLDLMDDPIQAQTLSVLQDGQEEGGYALYNPGIALRNNHYWFNLNPGGTYADGPGKRIAWQPEKPGDEPPADILKKDFRYHVDPAKRRVFERVEFRRACSMATNREAMLKTIYYGQAEPLYGFESPANRYWYNPDIPRYPYDPAAAGALLDSIGFRDRDGDGFREDTEGNTIRFTLITNKENKIRERVAVLLKEDLGKLGLDVQSQVLDFNNIITRIQDSFEYEACLLGLSNGVPPSPADSSNILLSNSRSHQWNPSQKTPATAWEAHIDELFAGLRTTFDEAEQQRLYDEIQVVWAENQPMVHTVVEQLWIAASNRVGNLKPSLMRPHMAHNTEELYLKPKGNAP